MFRVSLDRTLSKGELVRCDLSIDSAVIGNILVMPEVVTGQDRFDSLLFSSCSEAGFILLSFGEEKAAETQRRP